MKLQHLIQSTAEWLSVSADSSQPAIVMSSRLRLARNLDGHPFPTWGKKADREQVYALLFPAVSLLPEMKNKVLAESMDQFTSLEKQILVEQHLISREHAAKSSGCGVVVSQDRSLSIMINEEDHLRMQAFKPGFQIDAAYQIINRVDSELEEKLPFAFSNQYGYLTACPTNVGTGMRASVMMHLPGLVLHEQINQIIQAVSKLGLAVRGLYGEGTEALGNLFQVSNQMTLGESEPEIMERLSKVIEQIVQHEQDARATLLERRPRMVADQVGRAYGVLANCHSISSKEALNLLSVMRFGIEIGMLPPDLCAAVDDLTISTQPAHLQVRCDQKLSAEDRDGMRADLIREKMSLLKKPDTRALLKSLPARKEKKDE